MGEDCYYYYGYSSKNRSGHIPVFGDWDYANDLPITQYFECARQAGLIRHSSSSGEYDQRAAAATTTNNNAVAPPRKTRAREKRCPHVKEQKKAGRICDVTQPPTRRRQVAQRHDVHNEKLRRDDAVLSYPRPRLAAEARAPKAVDEDLYKIPPELLRSSNRKKRLGFISRCLVPACAA